MENFLAWLVLPSIALVAGSGFTVGFQTNDSNAPTVPTALVATAVSNSQINLSWTASTDAFGVSGYRIFRDAAFLATSTLTTYNDTGLTASTSYSYTVSAFDASLNISAHSATATATTTDMVVVATTTTATTTTSSGGSSAGCRPCYPCDTIRLNCNDGAGRFLPVAVSNLQISFNVSRLVLNWDNPVLPQFVGVRIIRSEKGFPQDAYDGAMVFSGQGDVFVDDAVVGGKKYYYGVFAVYFDDTLASPAVTFGTALVAEETKEVLEALPEELFDFKDFKFKQNGEDLNVLNGLIQVSSNSPIEVYVPGNSLPIEARVVVLELSSLGQSIGDWVLVYDRNANIYHGVLPPLAPGDFLVDGSVYDSSFNLIGVGGNTTLQSTGSEPEVVRPVDKTAVGPALSWWWLWLIILLVLGLSYRLFKEHSYEKGS